MIYIFSDEAGIDEITLKGEIHKYLIKVRRHKLGDEIYLRKIDKSEVLYKYKIIDLGARSLDLKLISSEIYEVKSPKDLHIGWCIIDSKSIEKVLPSLNEIGVSKISFIYCDRSQRNFKLDFKRFDRILEASMQQCGRSSFMKFKTYKSIENFIEKFPNTKVFDFSENILEGSVSFDTVLIGCEGGFSNNEKEFLKNQEVFRLNTPMILRSETAVISVASKILL